MSVCLSVPKDIANRWTKMTILNMDSFYFVLFLGRVQPPSKETPHHKDLSKPILFYFCSENFNLGGGYKHPIPLDAYTLNIYPYTCEKVSIYNSFILQRERGQ